MTLEPAARERIRLELVEYFAAAVRSIAIEQDADRGEVLRVLVEELSPYPESWSPRIVADITTRALESTPPKPGPPSIPSPRKARLSRRWKIGPFRGGT